jgi:DNA-binding NtrC family response regulator
MNSMSTKSIIVVEDDINLRQSITLILQRAGFLTTATDCVYKAMDILRSGKYHLIISDFDMPEMKNVFLPKLLVNYPSIPIFILTDQSFSEIEGEKRINAYYLAKPVAPECLVDSVRSILSKTDLSVHQKNRNIQCD